MYVEQVFEFCFTIWIKQLEEKLSHGNFITQALLVTQVYCHVGL